MSVSQRFSAMSPMRSVVLSVIHLLLPSLSPSGLPPSLVRVRKWRDSDVMGLHRLSRWIATLGDIPNTHTLSVWRSSAQTESHMRACVRSSSHTVAHMRDRTITEPAACTHTVQWAPGPVSWRSLNLTQCSSWKQAQGGIMASPPAPRLQTHVRTPERFYSLPLTHASSSSLKSSISVAAT